jgi:protocatechuate 3,4-dioxygenase alpha subunit
MTADPARRIASGSQTVGPFFHVGLTANERLGRLVFDDTPGERIRLRIAVLDGQGDPVPDAMVEIWQADASGAYVAADWRAVRRAPPAPRFTGFGRLPTDGHGTCEFQTLRPGRVGDGRATPQAAHIHVCLFMRGLLRQIYTRVYFADDPALADDAVLAAVPEGRRHTLLSTEVAGVAGTWAFDVHLQGDRETVFFDL